MLCVVSDVSSVSDLSDVSPLSPLNSFSAENAVSYVKINITPGHLHPAVHIKVLP